MKCIKEILVFYFIILFLSNTPVTKEIEICKIGGKEHICGKGKDDSGYMDDINVKFFTSCGMFQKSDNYYSCVCVRETTSGIWNNNLEAYDDSKVATYNTKQLTYQLSDKYSNKCLIGIDCSDITDESLCLNAKQCEYIDGKCSAKCAKHSSESSCYSDSSCRYDTEKSSCTNSSILPVFKLTSIIIISLFLI